MPRIRFQLLLCLLLLPLFSSQHARAADASKKLPPAYKHWIDVEVPYIISTDERKEFLALTTDAQRDSYIDTFWRIRNPQPGSELNEYKEEHYRRLAYVNSTFGVPGNEDGWRTDQGRMYIILGAPKQRAKYNDVGNVRPMEIWFYQSETPALPPYFYLVFYKRSAMEEFQLYSPRFDTPVRLVSTGESRNDPVQALGIIKKGLGEEVAREAVSLLPNEHVSLTEWSPSLESEALLTRINNLPDDPVTQEKLQANRLRERVTTSIFLGDQDATVSYDSFRDELGRMTLSYLMLLRYPNPQLVGTRADGGNYYDVTLRTDVVSAAGKPVYSQEDQITGNLNAAQTEVARKKRFGAEVRLPLVPGTYTIQSTLTNNVNKLAVRQRATVTVPQPSAQNIGISPLLAYTSPAGVPDPRNQLPFSGSHFRFTPRGAQNVYIHQGEKLPLVFQLWTDPKTAPTSDAPEKIHVRYVFGSIAAGHEDPVREEEDVDAANRDPAGNLLTGHTLDTTSLPPGNYQVTVSAARVGEQKTAYASLGLHVAPETEYVESWTAYGPADPGGQALDDYKRGLAGEAQGLDAEAQAAYERALSEGQQDVRPLESLTDLYGRKGMTAQLASLGDKPILLKTPASPAALLAIAAALNQTGNAKTAVRMLEGQLKIQQPTAALYNALAEASQASGNTTRANEARALAANLSK